MDQARLRKICIIKIHITDTFLKHVIQKRSLWKFFKFTYPDVKLVEIQPKLFLKATTKNFTIVQWPTILSWTARTEAKVI